jgi:hypothetical protein
VVGSGKGKLLETTTSTWGYIMGYFSFDEMEAASKADIALVVEASTIQINPTTDIVKKAGGNWVIRVREYGDITYAAWAIQNSDGTWAVCRPTESLDLADVVCVVSGESTALKILVQIAKGGEA